MRSRYLDVVTVKRELHVISGAPIDPDIDVSWIVKPVGDIAPFIRRHLARCAFCFWLLRAAR